MAEHVSPRVNSARLPDFNGRIVRLTGKVIRVSRAQKAPQSISNDQRALLKQNDASSEAIVVASDGGEVRVLLSAVRTSAKF